MAAALDAGADDMSDDESNWEIVSAPDAHAKRARRREELGIEPTSARSGDAAAELRQARRAGSAQQMLKLMEALEDHDDTRNVWSNFDIEEQEIEASLA